MDIALIVDKIFVYENGNVIVNLKADIESLLQTGTLPNKEQTANFNFNSMSNLYAAQYSQKIRNQKGKAYTVNVVNSPDRSLTTLTEIEKQQIFITSLASISNRLSQ